MLCLWRIALIQNGQTRSRSRGWRGDGRNSVDVIDVVSEVELFSDRAGTQLID